MASPPSTQPARHGHSHSLSASPPQVQSAAHNIGPTPKTANSFRASSGVAGPGAWSSQRVAANNQQRPNSEMSASVPKGQFQTAETEAIDQWFADLQHYEDTLQEMSAASLDAAFKEELSAIEQWFRVLSEAERTAALYSLLQSATQVQMRFFITVLQQMARNDPVAGGLMSPAAVNQASMESQMEAKLAALNVSGPGGKSSNPPLASPARFGRQSLGPQSSGLNPNSNNSSNSNSQQGDNYLSPNSATLLEDKRSKLMKQSARTSAPANLLLSASAGPGIGSSLWSDKEIERVIERSPSPSGRSQTGSDPQNFRPANSLSTPNIDYENQLSPLVGGSWASMVNTPLVPMFSKVPGPADGGSFGGLSSPGGPSSNSVAPPSWERRESIVLDDVRKFRRSARVSGEGASQPQRFGDDHSSGYPSSQQQPQRRSSGNTSNNNGFSQQNQNSQNGGGGYGTSSHLSTMQQNAINLGLAGLPRTPSGSHSMQSMQQQGGPLSPSALLSPQQAAISAQQNWRNGLASPSALDSLAHQQQQQQQQYSPLHNDQFATFGANNHHHLNSNNLGSAAGGNGGLNGVGSPQAQLANLLALQQQMQMQQLNLAAAAGIALTPVQMMGLQQQQQQQQQQQGLNGAGGAGGAMLSPGGRMMGMGGMGMGGMGMGGMGAMGMGAMGMMGMPSPRRSPRSGNDRSPGLSNSGGKSSSNMPSAAGSGSNPDEPLDMSLLGDVNAWLRSLRLHKYNDNFKGSNWKEMIMLDDKGLEDKGVSALGARRKLLKVFEVVRAKTGNALPTDGQKSPDTNNLAVADDASTRSHSPASPEEPRDP